MARILVTPWMDVPVLLATLVTASPEALPPPDTADTPANADIPARVIEDMTRMIGRWVADNTAYRSENEPFDTNGQ